MGRRLIGVLPLLLLSGCYGYRSAAGHLSLLWHSRSISATIVDPRTRPGRRETLKLVLDIRRYAEEKLSLGHSRDYASWTPVGGAVTWLVYACPKDSLKPVSFLGFPYKGHFRREWADAEAANWRAKGYDATVVGAAAYNTPLPFADPLPSSVLSYPPGDLAELLIHEAAHGALGSEESAAEWVGEHGAAQFLSERYGADSPELLEWRADAAKAETRAVLFDELAKFLEEDYAAGRAAARERRFAWAREEAAKTEVELPDELNNAVVAAHRVYRGDPKKYDDLFEKSGRDWKAFVAALKRR